MDYYSALKKEGNSVILDYINEAGGYYAKWNKPDRERQVLHSTTYMWNSNSEKQGVEW